MFEIPAAIVQIMSPRQSTSRGVLLALFYAIFGSVIGTLMHQTKLNSEVPIGLLFSFALVIMLAANIRDHQIKKLPGAMFAISLGLILFLIGQNFSGDILIPGNDLGLWWSYGAIGLAALIALWPKLKR
jgi:xanthine/uracil permease